MWLLTRSCWPNVGRLVWLVLLTTRHWGLAIYLIKRCFSSYFHESIEVVLTSMTTADFSPAWKGFGGGGWVWRWKPTSSENVLLQICCCDRLRVWSSLIFLIIDVYKFPSQTNDVNWSINYCSMWPEQVNCKPFTGVQLRSSFRSDKWRYSNLVSLAFKISTYLLIDGAIIAAATSLWINFIGEVSIHAQNKECGFAVFQKWTNHRSL